MEKLKASHDVQVTWRSFELRPVDGPSLPPEYLASVKAKRPQFYAMAKERYGLNLKPGPFGINSRPALIGAKYAEMQGVGDDYHAAIFRVYWLEEQDISDEAILLKVAQSINLDVAGFAAALADDDYYRQVIADVEQAHNYGLSGVPALIFAQRYLVSGAQPYDVLVNVVEQIEKERVNG